MSEDKGEAKRPDKRILKFNIALRSMQKRVSLENPHISNI